jgi:predicted O-methyltransferase YrrM
MHLPWRDVAPGPGPAIATSITDAESAKLRELAGEGRRVLEVGSAFGYSAVVMALARAEVHAVDPHDWLQSAGVMAANLGFYGVADRVVVDRRRSNEALPALADAGERFNLVFVDGDHAREAVEHDVSWGLKLLAPGGVLACHDYGEDCCCPGVRAALDGWPPDGPDELVDTLFVVRP